MDGKNDELDDRLKEHVTRLTILGKRVLCKRHGLRKEGITVTMPVPETARVKLKDGTEIDVPGVDEVACQHGRSCCHLTHAPETAMPRELRDLLFRRIGDTLYVCREFVKESPIRDGGVDLVLNDGRTFHIPGVLHVDARARYKRTRQC